MRVQGSINLDSPPPGDASRSLASVACAAPRVRAVRLLVRGDESPAGVAVSSLIRQPRNRTRRRRLAGSALSTNWGPDLSTGMGVRWTVRRVTPWSGVSPRGPACHPVARHIRQAPAAVRAELEAREWVVGEEEAAVEVHPFGEARDRGGRGDPDGRLLHAAEERIGTQFANAGQHAGRW